MLLSTKIQPSFIDDECFDVVERKGAGHPDSLADGLAEAVSRQYCQESLKRFGVILHHNSDKTALLGGSSRVTFGAGEITRPINALINGRFSSGLGTDKIPVEELVETEVRRFLKERLPLLNVERDVLISLRNNPTSSPGHVKSHHNTHNGTRGNWFAPRSLADLPELTRPFSNDTSFGVGYAPLSVCERVATGVERFLNSAEFKNAHPEFGSDIKIMVCRAYRDLNVTFCVPMIALHTPDLQAYIDGKRFLLEIVEQRVAEIAPGYRPYLSVNTRDDHEKSELYLTAVGTALESGDEGMVGRGNRVSGVISMMRPMSIEGVAGKNPVYHVGKLYNLLAQRAADEIHRITGFPTTVCLVSQSGRDLNDPWFACVEQARPGCVDEALVRKALEDVLSRIDEVRAKLLDGSLDVC